MKEMRLFEIGFKEKPYHTSYSEKFYVAAGDAEEALEKAKAWIDAGWQKWWKEDGEIDAQVEILYDEMKETFGNDDVPDKWIEKRFKDNPVLQGELAKRRTEAMNRSGFLSLAKLLDVGEVIV